MRLRNNADFKGVEHLLSTVTRGQSAQQWAESITINLLKEVQQCRPPVKLNGELIKARRIEKIKKLDKDIPERARLILGDNGFIIELARRYLSNRYYAFWYRLALAHEVAHTFFYDINVWPPRQLIFTDSGNREFEALCDYLARTLLMPTPWLQEQLSHLPSPGSTAFSLAILDQLKKTFKVPWQVLARRLVEDLALWDCIILQFAMSNERDKNDTYKPEPVWHLKSQIIPTRVRTKLYIPVGRKIDGVRKYPSTKGVLSEFIENCFRIGQEKQFFQQIIETKLIGTSTTGNLRKFLYEALGATEVKVHFSVNVLSQENIFDKMPNHKFSPIVLMCIPLISQK